MFLKKIELSGFKSFASRTIIDLEPKVTAIVGPNGCGKSNIGDAIRWVLGEQNPRLLRGSKMEDVIFNGTDTKKPIGRAEVTLTFDNSKSKLAVGFSEVTITRRLFRSGDSEYYINKTPCRLKDIRNLVLDTGIGTRSYYLMEQGKIDLILSSKPEERRQVFEEAAGINRYKTQKKEALNRLESTEKNLNRVTDILREVKRQIGSVQRQAGKARQYQKIRDELKDLEIKDAYFKKKAIDKTRDLKETELAAEKSNKTSVLKRLGDLGKNNDTLKKEFSSLQQQYNKAQKEKMEAAYKAEQDIGQTKMINERLFEIQTRVEAAKAEIEEFSGKLQLLQENKEKQEAVLADIVRETGREITPCKETEGALNSLLKDILSAEKNLDESKTQLMDSMNVDARNSNEIRACDEKHRMQKLRFEKIGGEIDEIEQRISAKQKTLQDINRELKHSEKQAHDAKRIRSEKASLINREQEKLRTVDSVLSELNKSFIELKSRKDLMKEMQARLEGCSEGVKAILSKSKCKPDDTCRLLSDILTIPEKYESAAEAVLEDSFQNLVVHTMSQAETLLTYLKQNNKGRASIMPLDFLKEKEPAMSLPLLEGVLGFLTDLIQWEQPYELAVKSLLGDVVIVDRIDQALKLQPEILSSYRFVSLDGDSLNVTEGIRGGNRSGREEGLLTRKSKIERLEKKIDEIEKKIASASTEKTTVSDRINQYDQEFQESTNFLHENEMKVARTQNDQARMSAKIQELEERIRELKSESAALQETMNKGESEKETLLEKISADQKNREALHLNIASTEKILSSLKTKRENLFIEHARLKALMEAARERQETAKKRLEEIELSMAEIREMLIKREEEIKAAHAKTNDLNTRLSAIGSRETSHETEKHKFEEKVQLLQGELETQQSAQAQTEQQIEDLRNKSDALSQSINSLEVVLTEQRIKSQTEEDRIWEKYEVRLNDLLIELSPETETDRLRIDTLKAKINNIGPVNLVAIEEFNSLKERYDFLTKQNKDLVDSRASLLKVIERINETTEVMFLETFEKIRSHFKVLFKELLGGGRADLMLLDETEVLESGIDIVASPPGKKLQSISLLSGGERSLTALALLLAMFKEKPSPFCLLDEIDAALDDSNTKRFSEILKDFSEKSQFIIVTHNKKTIAIAELIYGVTMEESGISKIVSVKFVSEQSPLVESAVAS